MIADVSNKAVITLKIKIFNEGYSFIDRSDKEKKPHMTDDEAPAKKYFALEFNLCLYCNHRNFNIHILR